MRCNYQKSVRDELTQKLTTILIILIVVLGGYTLFQLLLLIGLIIRPDRLAEKLPQGLPKVTIMVAARNEEANILACLEALSKLSYPESHLQILIGNDHSTDATEQLIRYFIQDKAHFTYSNIEANLGQAQGKANVLANLANSAQGDWWLITDADVMVPVDWVQSMIEVQQKKQADKSVGIVTGFTLVQGKSLFARLQAIDWIYALGLIKVWSDQGIPVTAMGNNLGVLPKAYRAIGGYENIPFSITEDFALFQEIIKQGFHFRNVIHLKLTATTQPVSTVKAWLHQRKRWMSGALQAPWFLSLFFALHACFWPLVVALFFIDFRWAIGFASMKLSTQSTFIGVILKRIRQCSLWPYLILFELYHVVFTWMMLLFYFLPIQVVWKGRRY